MDRTRALMQARPMNRSSRSQLIQCDDTNFYVVKFQPQNGAARNLVAECMGTLLARTVGLTVPEFKIVEVDPFVMKYCYYLRRNSEDQGESKIYLSDCYRHGLQFGSRLLPWGSGSSTFDILPSEQLLQVPNYSEFAGAFAFDTWISNQSPRKTLVHRPARKSKYSAYFINFDQSFGGLDWEFTTAEGTCLYPWGNVYRYLTGWIDFEPHLSNILTLTPDRIWEIAKNIPLEWIGEENAQIERLVQRLLDRRSKLHGLLARTIAAHAGHFPQWAPRPFVSLTSPKRTEAIALPAALGSNP